MFTYAITHSRTKAASVGPQMQYIKEDQNCETQEKQIIFNTVKWYLLSPIMDPPVLEHVFTSTNFYLKSGAWYHIPKPTE